ncbi:MAG TPA: OmpA family protein [Candidatus Binataceae bacterium]|nr:OmpA family protein [Candidatus Binataceae bacterium]
MKYQSTLKSSAKIGRPSRLIGIARKSLAGLTIAALPMALMISGCSQGTSASAQPAQPVAAAQSIPSPEKVDLRGVEFQPDGRLSAKSKPVLDAAAQLLKTQPDATRVYIDAYCDPSGGAKLNKMLADERANAVKAYLVKHGVSSDRLVARGRGATDFVASNSTREGRKENRRIELVIVRS